MKLASKEAIGLMLDGKVLVNGDKKALYENSYVFLIKDGLLKYSVHSDLWQSEGWELQKKYKPLPEKFTHDWANCRAVNSFGELNEYGDKASGLWFTQYQWVNGSGMKVALISKGHDPTNWTNSLEERKREPEEKTRNKVHEIKVKIDTGAPILQDLKEWALELSRTDSKAYEGLKFNSGHITIEPTVTDRLARIEKHLGLS